MTKKIDLSCFYVIFHLAKEVIDLNTINLQQVMLLLSNDKNKSIETICSKQDFIFLFLNHLSEYFSSYNMKFKILEPLLDPEFKEEQQTVLSIDNVEVGELFLNINSFSDESSLVYYSPSGLIESIVFDYDKFENYPLSDYLLLVHDFSSYLYGEKNLKNK